MSIVDRLAFLFRAWVRTPLSQTPWLGRLLGSKARYADGVRIVDLPSYLIRIWIRQPLSKTPVVNRIFGKLANIFYRLVLLPYGLPRQVGKTLAGGEPAESLTEYSDASERYFADYPDVDFILRKPFSEADAFPKRLFDLGVLTAGLRLKPADVVVEMGAGTCWLSHLLNRYGCKTIAIDVSQTALDLGRRLFEESSETNWDLEPEFVRYDGGTIPLPDGSCDKVIFYDAFHHIPNQREILCELRRVLRPFGIVAAREPGQGHSNTPESDHEVELGMLERDVVAEDVARLARECGFADVTAIPASPQALIEIPAKDFGLFMRGKHFCRYWTRLTEALQEETFVFLHRDPSAPTTRAPVRPAAEIRARGRRPWRLRRGESHRASLELRNVGESTWLTDETIRPGWTRLGAHLYRVENGRRELVDFDWLRAALPHDLGQGKAVRLALELPALERPGTYEVEFDIVIEGLLWFAQRGSEVRRVALEVS